MGVILLHPVSRLTDAPERGFSAAVVSIIQPAL